MAYVAALGAVVVATAVRVLADLTLDQPPSFLAYYPAVLFATLVGGLRGGLVAMLASAVAMGVLPNGPMAKIWPSQPLRLLMFVLTAGAMALVAETLRRSLQQGAIVEARFRQIANAAPVLIWMSSLDQKASWFNESWLTFTGRDLEQELGLGWLDSVHPDDLASLQIEHQFRTNGTTSGRFEYRLRRQDGSYRWLEESAAPSFDINGKVLGYVGSCVDITERRNAEASLRIGEARIRALVDSLPQLLWANRADGFCDYLSPQWLAFTGAPAESHKGEGWFDAVHPEDRDYVRLSWREAVRGGLPFDVKYRIRRHDGVWRWFAGRASSVRNEDGSIRRWFGSSSDITEIVEARKDLELRVAERTLELQESLEERARTEAALAQAQRLETVGRLTGGVAHDFNNLLTVVIGGLDMILKNPADTARVKRLSEAAMAAGRRGERLTRQLLSFSRRQELKPELINVVGLIDQIEPLLRRAVLEAVELKITSQDSVGLCRLDPAQFEAALLNLVVNATDAVGGHGKIEIAVLCRTLIEGEIAGAVAGDYVGMSVSDTGPGMSPEVLSRAFEPFFTTKEVGKGTGLGLAQVYGFIRQAGGVADLESRPGEGVKVTLLVPAVEGRLELLEPLVDDLAHMKWVREPRILLVEDDAAVRTVTESLLGEMGCQVIAEPDGTQALARLDAGEVFDLVLSDIVMPGGISGVDLARLAQSRRPGLPIILTTGYAGDRFDGSAEDIDLPILRKPFRAEDLAAMVHESLANTGLIEQRSPTPDQGQPARLKAALSSEA